MSALKVTVLGSTSSSTMVSKTSNAVSQSAAFSQAEMREE